ncbi:DUF6265 family protein [Flavobacterium sp. N1719]|uniref:DUF6265 family protein n=1 Tax=Flavobacterium sp. N1719 TaxID=2885633 RepID=UPI0022229BA1|nr:DUF6265 family protein [Flavobacterium sp. N1719]
MKKIILSILALGFIAISCKKYDTFGNEIRFVELNKAAFLEGNWEVQDSLGVLQLQWKTENDSTFSGTSYFIQGEKKDTLHRETIELQQRDEHLFYTTSVQGEKGDTPITFQLTKDADSLAVFENPKNDYPSKIEFRLQKDGKIKQTESGTVLKKPKTQQYLWTKSNTKSEN